jgi:hypothetical protein
MIPGVFEKVEGWGTIEVEILAAQDRVFTRRACKSKSLVCRHSLQRTKELVQNTEEHEDPQRGKSERNRPD